MRRIAAAAAGVLILGAAAAGIWIFRSTPESEPIGSSAPASLRIEGIADVFSTGKGEGLDRDLPDGTRLRISERTRARFRTPAAGERHCLELISGQVEVTAGKGRGTLRVIHEAGRIDVLGTRFRAWTASLAGGDALPGLPRCETLGVEVYEGRVALANGAGQAIVKPGERGIALPAAVPSVQEQGGSPETILASLGNLLGKEGGAVSIAPGKGSGAALLLTVLEGMSRKELAEGRPPLREDRPPALRAAAEAARKALPRPGEPDGE